MMKLSGHYSDTPLSSICELKNQTLWFFHELCLHNYKFIFLRDLNVIVSKLFFDIHPFLICEFKQKKTNKNKTTSTLLYLKILLTYFLFIFFENQNTLKIFYNLSSLILDHKHSDMSVTFVYTFLWFSFWALFFTDFFVGSLSSPCHFPGVSRPRSTVKSPNPHGVVIRQGG